MIINNFSLPKLGQHKGKNSWKSGIAAESTLVNLISTFGENHTVIVTLTFLTQQISSHDARNEVTNLLKCLKRKYPELEYFLVHERTIDGTLHFHLALGVQFDVLEGTCLSMFKGNHHGDCRNPIVLKQLNPELRELNEFIIKRIPRYGIGRFDAIPIHSDDPWDAINYFTKTLWLSYINRDFLDRGVRIWSSSRGIKNHTVRFSGIGARSWLWRHRLKAWANKKGYKDFKKLSKCLRKSWAFVHGTEISNTPLLPEDENKFLEFFPDDVDLLSE